MNKTELRRLAVDTAAGLLDAMDLEAFWGEDICFNAGGTDKALDELTLIKDQIVAKIRVLK